MANTKGFKMSTEERRMRRFSDNFKQKKVREIESRTSSIGEISRQYEVSTNNIYRWIGKFGSMKNKKDRLIVESESDTKQLLELKKKVAELERLVGQKQIQLEFTNKMIELAEETYGVDIKKKFSAKPSTTIDPDVKKKPSA